MAAGLSLAAGRRGPGDGNGPRVAGVAGGSRDLVLYFKLLIYIHFLMFFSATSATPSLPWLARGLTGLGALFDGGDVRASDIYGPSQRPVEIPPTSRGS